MSGKNIVIVAKRRWLTQLCLLGEWVGVIKSSQDYSLEVKFIDDFYYCYYFVVVKKLFFNIKTKKCQIENNPTNFILVLNFVLAQKYQLEVCQIKQLI